jgi:hypothetical protein
MAEGVMEAASFLEPTDRVEMQAEIDRIMSRLKFLRDVTEAAISRLLDQRSEIQASGKCLANLSSQHLELCSSLARIQEVLSSQQRAD